VPNLFETKIIISHKACAMCHRRSIFQEPLPDILLDICTTNFPAFDRPKFIQYTKFGTRTVHRLCTSFTWRRWWSPNSAYPPPRRPAAEQYPCQIKYIKREHASEDGAVDCPWRKERKGGCVSVVRGPLCIREGEIV
jgi:hypothetical protein